MQNEALVRALDVCIQKMQGGEKIEQALELYPQWSGDLTPPLEAVQVLRVYSESLSISAVVSQSCREQFFISAQQLNHRSDEDRSQHIRVARLTWLITAVSLLIASIWIYVITSRALPDSTFYPLKNMYWQARLGLNTSPLDRLLTQRNYDQMRLDEINTLASRGTPASIEFAGLLEQDQPENWVVGGIPVTVPPQAQVIGEVLNHTWVQVQGELGRDGTVTANQIRAREYTFNGIIQEISPDELRVSNIPVRLSIDTLVHGSPMAGSQVNVIAIRAADDSLVARLVETSEPTP